MTYEIEGESASAPALPGEVVLAQDADSAIDRIAEDLVQQASESVRQFGDFHVALSGIELFDPLHRRLMYDPNFRWLPWRRTHVWLTEEDPDGSRAAAIHDFIGAFTDLPTSQFHAMPLGEPDPAAVYEQHVREVLSDRQAGERRFDYALLAVDEDGVAGGLFPGSPAIDDERLYCSCAAPGGAGVVMTSSAVAGTRMAALCAVGAATRDAVAALSGGTTDLPLAHVARESEHVVWYVDLEAAGGE